MTARHAGESRIADQALIDQVRTCTEDIRAMFGIPTGFPSVRPDVGTVSKQELLRWAGRALALLEQIGELGQ